MQQQIEVLEGEGKDDVTLRDIQKILYSTEVRPLSLFLSFFVTFLLFRCNDLTSLVLSLSWLCRTGLKCQKQGRLSMRKKPFKYFHFPGCGSLERAVRRRGLIQYDTHTHTHRYRHIAVFKGIRSFFLRSFGFRPFFWRLSLPFLLYMYRLMITLHHIPFFFSSAFLVSQSYMVEFVNGKGYAYL